MEFYGETMLKRIKIRNFKALRDIDSLDIKPITFFVGPNSSGKSSAFQVLLALKQTIRSSDENTPLILQDYIDLGSYKDIIWNHATELATAISSGVPSLRASSNEAPSAVKVRIVSVSVALEPEIVSSWRRQ